MLIYPFIYLVFLYLYLQRCHVTVRTHTYFYVIVPTVTERGVGTGVVCTNTVLTTVLTVTCGDNAVYLMLLTYLIIG